MIEAFEALPETEREVVPAELIRRVAQSDHGSPTDDELVEVADRVFLEFDRSENEA